MTRYLANSNTKEVHDLTYENPNCQIQEIKPEHRVPYANLSAAHADGYDNCAWCLEGSRR